MQKRFKLWMADWRDANGKRHRKGFKTRQDAEAWTIRRKAEEAKKAHPSTDSARSSRGGRAASRKARTRQSPQRRSSKQQRSSASAS